MYESVQLQSYLERHSGRHAACSNQHSCDETLRHRGAARPFSHAAEMQAFLLRPEFLNVPFADQRLTDSIPLE